MKIRIATHDDQRMVVIQEAVKQFRKEHPGVSVVLELVPRYTDDSRECPKIEHQ